MYEESAFPRVPEDWSSLLQLIVALEALPLLPNPAESASTADGEPQLLHARNNVVALHLGGGPGALLSGYLVLVTRDSAAVDVYHQTGCWFVPWAVVALLALKPALPARPARGWS